MRKRNIEIAVGLFVLFGIASLAVLAVHVSGLIDIYSNEEGYVITVDFENVGGLKPKARVSMAGVQVGRVQNISLDNEFFYARVTMQINKSIDKLPDDTRASILTAGLLGDNYIGLTPGFSDQYLKPNSHILVENTNKAVVLEELISKFVASQASGE